MRPAVPVTLEPAVPMPVPAKWHVRPIAAVRGIRGQMLSNWLLQDLGRWERHYRKQNVSSGQQIIIIYGTLQCTTIMKPLAAVLSQVL